MGVIPGTVLEENPGVELGNVGVPREKDRHLGGGDRILKSEGDNLPLLLAELILELSLLLELMLE